MLKFDFIPGRENLKKRLASEISEGKIGNAYIFEGPEGCGKKEMATAFALMILCTGKGEKPCGECPHCKGIRAGGNGELYALETGKGSIPVGSIRKLQENISLMPVSSNRKVYLIPGADRMTPQAQNCILKTLEEPPPYAHILMTAQDCGKLLDTVRSRAVILQTGINSVEEIERYLIAHTDSDASGVAVAARCSSGSYKKALEILESEEFQKGRQAAVSFLINIIDKDYKKARELLGKLKKDETTGFFGTVSGLLRDMVLQRTGVDDELLINVDLRDTIIKGANRYPENVLTGISFIMEQTAERINRNASMKQGFDAMIIRITEELAKW